MFSVECLSSPLRQGGDKGGNVGGIQDNNYQGIQHRNKFHLHLKNIRVKKTCHGQALPDISSQIPLLG